MARGTPLDMEWTKELKQARRSAGFTQRDLADKLGLSQSTIAGYETGIRTPDVDLADRWLALCGGRIEVIPPGKDPIGASVPVDLLPELRPLLEGYVRATPDVRRSIQILLSSLR